MMRRPREQQENVEPYGSLMLQPVNVGWQEHTRSDAYQGESLHPSIPINRSSVAGGVVN